MKTVVVTGGIGSGKSAVCAVLSSLGVPVYDSDSRTKELYDRDPALVDRIAEAFRAEGVTAPILKDDGSLDRRALAGLVFSSDNLLKILEDIVHPAVLEDFLTWKGRMAGEEWKGPGKEPFAVFESAIVMDKPLFRGMAEKVVEVRSPKELRIRRVMSRDRASEKEVERRMDSQGGASFTPDAVIVNDSTLEALEKEVREIFSSLFQ